MIRVLILVSSRINRYRQDVFRIMLAASDIDIVGVCVDCRPGIGTLAKIRREMKRGRGGYVLVQCIMGLVKMLTKPDVSSRFFFKTTSVPCILTHDLYSSETIEQIRIAEPDVIFRFGFGIIREPILSLAPSGVLSYHHGDMRKYRGQPPAFWELYHGEMEMGITVQVLSAGLDSGAIIVEKKIPIRPNDTWA